MSYFEFRQYWESQIIWWVPFAAPLVVSAAIILFVFAEEYWSKFCHWFNYTRKFKK